MNESMDGPQRTATTVCVTLPVHTVRFILLGFWTQFECDFCCIYWMESMLCLLIDAFIVWLKLEINLWKEWIARLCLLSGEVGCGGFMWRWIVSHVF